MKSLQNRDDLINEVAVADKQKEQRMNKMDLQSKFCKLFSLKTLFTGRLERAVISLESTRLP